MKKIIFIGAGNLATQLSSAMKEQGYDIVKASKMQKYWGHPYLVTTPMTSIK